jgi:hypothetical protein
MPHFKELKRNFGSSLLHILLTGIDLSKLSFAKSKMHIFLKKEVARGGEQTRVLSISFSFSFHHFTTELQRLPVA